MFLSAKLSESPIGALTVDFGNFLELGSDHSTVSLLAKEGQVPSDTSHQQLWALLYQGLLFAQSWCGIFSGTPLVLKKPLHSSSWEKPRVLKPVVTCVQTGRTTLACLVKSVSFT